MHANELLAALRARAFQLTVREGRLVVTPGSALGEDDRRAITANRDELVRLVGEEALIIGAFPGAQFRGVHAPGAFQGPMRPLPNQGRCPKCGGQKHFRGKKVCGLCADGGMEAVVGENFEDALVFVDALNPKRP